MSDVSRRVRLRLEVMEYVPELPTDRNEAIDFIEREIEKVVGNQVSVITGVRDRGDALIALDELLRFVRTYLFEEFSSSES